MRNLGQIQEVRCTVDVVSGEEEVGAKDDSQVSALHNIGITWARFRGLTMNWIGQN